MNNNQSEKDSYSYWEWRLTMTSYASKLSPGMDELTENGRKFVRFDVFSLILVGFIVILSMLPIMFLLFSAFDTWSEPFRTIGIIMYFTLLLPSPFVMDFIIFPGKGRIAHAGGYITDDELQIILKRRVPYSIFLDPKNTPPAFCQRKSTYIPPVIHYSRWTIAAEFFSAFSFLLFPAPIALVLGIIALRHGYKYSLSDKAVAREAIIRGAIFSLVLIGIIYLGYS